TLLSGMDEAFALLMQGNGVDITRWRTDHVVAAVERTASPVAGRLPGDRSRVRLPACLRRGRGYATSPQLTCWPGQLPAAARSAATSASSAVRC
ncbi:hypothetical protein AB0D72_35470, partial [Streptomyces sp. NPDC048188]